MVAECLLFTPTGIQWPGFNSSQVFNDMLTTGVLTACVTDLNRKYQFNLVATFICYSFKFIHYLATYFAAEANKYDVKDILKCRVRELARRILMNESKLISSRLIWMDF